MEKYNNRNRGSGSYPNKKNNNNKRNYIDYNKELLKISKLDIKDGDIVSVQMNDDSMKVSDIKRFIDLIPSRLGKDVRVLVLPKNIEIKTVNEKRLDDIISTLISIRDFIKEENNNNEVKNN